MTWQDSLNKLSSRKYQWLTICHLYTQQSQQERQQEPAIQFSSIVYFTGTDNSPQRTTKVQLYRVYIQPILLYCSETRALTRALEDRIAAFDNTSNDDAFSGFRIQPMQLLLKYDSELALHYSCCRSSKQDGSISSGTWHGWAIRKTRPEPYIRRFAGYPRTGGAVQDVHVAPGCGPWKQTSSRSITVWTQPGDSLRTENDGGNLWKQLCSSQGHARDDDMNAPDPNLASSWRLRRLASDSSSLIQRLQLRSEKNTNCSKTDITQTEFYLT